MPFTTQHTGTRLSEPLQRDKIFQVTADNGLIVFISSAQIPVDQWGTLGKFHWVDPEFLDLSHDLSSQEHNDFKRSMKERYGWDAAFIEAASQHLVLGIDSLRVGSPLAGRWHSLLEPIRDFSTLNMINRLRPIREVHEVSISEARHLASESA